MLFSATISSAGAEIKDNISISSWRRPVSEDRPEPVWNKTLQPTQKYLYDLNVFDWLRQVWKGNSDTPSFAYRKFSYVEPLSDTFSLTQSSSSETKEGELDLYYEAANVYKMPLVPSRPFLPSSETLDSSASAPFLDTPRYSEKRNFSFPETPKAPSDGAEQLVQSIKSSESKEEPTEEKDQTLSSTESQFKSSESSEETIDEADESLSSIQSQSSSENPGYSPVSNKEEKSSLLEERTHQSRSFSEEYPHPTPRTRDRPSFPQKLTAFVDRPFTPAASGNWRKNRYKVSQRAIPDYPGPNPKCTTGKTQDLMTEATKERRKLYEKICNIQYSSEAINLSTLEDD